MTEKVISIYGNTTAQAPFSNNRLVVEISATHIAIWVNTATDNSAGAFELFQFDSAVTSWYDVFYSVRSQSNILDGGYMDTRVFFNFPETIITPASKFTDEAAREFLAMVHGEIITDVVKHDDIDVHPALVNAYAVSNDLDDMINGNLMMVTPRHSASVLVENVLRSNHPFQNSLFIKVQFYHKHFMVAATHNGQLLLVQSYEHNGPEDMLYYLLNIVEQHHFTPDDAVLELSGTFELVSAIYEDLCKVFSKIKLDHMQDSRRFHPDVDTYGSHYLTPFFNLLP